MVQDNQEKTAQTLVDTLFGPEPTRRERQAAAVDEELPHYLFCDRDDSQPVLPLVDLPHYRPNVLKQLRISALIPYLDELSLFEKQWGYAKTRGTRENWCRWVEAEAVPVLDKLVAICQENDLLQPKSVYAYLHCDSEGDTVHIYGEHGAEPVLSIDMPRLANGSCAADKVCRADSGVRDTLAAVAVNMGRNASDMAKKWLSAGKEVDYKYLHGFALEMLRAMTEYTAAAVAREGCCLGQVCPLGTAKEGSAKVQSVLVKMLDASLIDVAFSRNYLMMPEYSSLALILPK